MSEDIGTLVELVQFSLVNLIGGYVAAGVAGWRLTVLVNLVLSELVLLGVVIADGLGAFPRELPADPSELHMVYAYAALGLVLYVIPLSLVGLGIRRFKDRRTKHNT